MKTLTALAILVAVAMPARADSDKESAIELVSHLASGCGAPTVVGTVTGVHADPQIFGTDIEMDHATPNAGTKYIFSSLTSHWRSDGVFTVFVPLHTVKKLSGLNDYVGQKVIIWAYAASVGISEYAGTKNVFEIANPNQLQLASTVMAAPKKTWCYRNQD